jgi:type 1 glutamine amidotransferase
MRLFLQVLIVTATAGYRHDSIPAAEEILASIATEQQAEVSFARTEDELRERLGDLGNVTAIFFVNTTGELPSPEKVVAFVRNGGTFVGIHAASDTWHSSPDYLEMLGGEFIGHPPETTATVVVDDPGHLATRTLPPTHALFEEFYSLGRVDLTSMRTLLSLRIRPEAPYGAGYLPLAWEKRFGAGRVLYTALGHREDVWRSAWFHAHLAGVMQWAVHPPEQPKRRSVRH